MNIAIWIYKLGNGGAERVMADLSASFCQNGHAVTLLTHTDDNPYLAVQSSNMKIVNLAARIPAFLKPKTVFCLWGLIKYIKTQKPDIVFTTGVQHSVILLFLLRVFGSASKIVIRETNTISAQNKNSKNFIDKIGFLFARILYPLADVIIAPSNGVAEDLKNHIQNIEQKLHVIPNLVDFEGIEEKSKELLPNNDFLNAPFILAVGRLVPQKGFHDLIEVWALIYREQKVNLVILGEGGERKRLVNLAKELNVQEGLYLQGFDVNPFRYMARCEVFVLSSYYEGLPNTLLQALACGAPVIATDCPSGPREILQGGKLGMLVQVGDKRALQKAIEMALNSNAKTTDFKKEIEPIYKTENVTKRYLELFEDLQEEEIK